MKLQAAQILSLLFLSAFWLNFIFKIFMTIINFQIPPQISGNVFQFWETALTQSEETFF